MIRFSIDTESNHVSSEWWKQLIKHFVKVGDNMEIRCWKGEADEILKAKHYGKATEDGYEVSIKAVVSEKLLEELMAENPYGEECGKNKMTKYFSLFVDNELCDMSSEHYGTEFYICIFSEEDILFFREVMSKYTGDDLLIRKTCL